MILDRLLFTKHRGNVRIASGHFSFLYGFSITARPLHTVSMEYKQFTKSPFRDEDNFIVAQPQQAEAKCRKFEPARLVTTQSEGKNNQRTSQRFAIDDDVQSVDTESSCESERISGRKSAGSTQDINTAERHGIDHNVNAAQRLLVGTIVEARFRGKSHYFKGKIVRTRFNGSFDIMYDNGERELGVSRDLIREICVEEEQSQSDKQRGTSNRRAPENADNDGSPIQVGSMLEMRNEDGKFIPAKIMRIRSDGTYDILCQDEGSPEFGKFGVPRKLLRLPSSSVKKSPIQKARPTPTNATSKKNLLESPLVEKQEIYRSLHSSTSDRNLDSPDIDVGSLVEARYRGKHKYWPGKITRKRYDGSYDIFYSDGERELCVSKELIRVRTDSRQEQEKRNEASLPLTEQALKEQKQMNTEVSELRIGDDVEARYRGKRKYYAGTITRKRFDGTYDISYDDGDKEIQVSRELIIAKTAAAEEVNGQNEMVKVLGCTGELFVGTRIRARYRGKSKFFPGQIMKCRENKKFDIRYDDGEEEIKVSRNLIVDLSKEHAQLPTQNIALSDSTPNLSISPPKTEFVGNSTELDVGVEVEARYRGKSAFYQGKITRKRYDGSFDILFVDGEREIGVSKEFIRIKRRPQETVVDCQVPPKSDMGVHCVENIHVPGSESPDQDPIFSIGDKVECRYKGAQNGIFYPGVISNIHLDTGTTTYDIQYDDGDKDFRLAVDNVRTVTQSRIVNEALSNVLPQQRDCQRQIDGDYTRSTVDSVSQKVSTFNLEKIEEVKRCVSSIHNAVGQINAIDLNAHIRAQDMNKLMCLINEKEDYAKKTIAIIVEILSKEIKVELFVSEDKYLSILKAHHVILQKAMKCIHTVDETDVADLNRAVEDSERLFLEEGAKLR